MVSKILNKNELYEKTNSELSDKKHISFSEFSLFNECGHKHLIFKHLKLDEQPPSIHLYFGNAIHAAIESSFRENTSLENRIEIFKLAFRKDMLDNLRETPTFKDVEDFVLQGENILKVLTIEKIFEDYDVISVEEPLYELVYNKFFFKGFIDLVVRNKKTGRILIVDWKTSGEKWDLVKKMKDNIFLCQMRFYKFFWGRKNNVDLSEIDCKYVVLNRLKKKNNAKSGFGELQNVEVQSNEDEIKQSLEKLASTIRKIHIEKNFTKVKTVSSEKMGCMFCKFKGGTHPLCNSHRHQDKQLLQEHSKKLQNGLL